MRVGGRGWVAAAVLLVGCGGAEPDTAAPAPLVRDSAGLRVVETTATIAVPAPWTVAPEPTVSVGAAEGDPSLLLAGVVGALRLADGALLVANAQTSELKTFDPDGTPRATVGGEGEGPGEYTYLRGVRRCFEDGFVGFDLNWQMNRYRADGSFVDRVALVLPDGYTPYSLACDDHGHRVVVSWGDAVRDGSLGFVSSYDRVVRLDEEGRPVADFGRRLVSERVASERGSMPHPFGRGTTFAIHDDFLYIGDGTGLEVEVWSLDGSRRAILRGPPDDGVIKDEERAAYVDARVETTRPEAREAARRELEAMPWPERAPTFDRIVVDEVGIVWVRRFAPLGSEGAETWALLSPAAGYLGELALPGGGHLLEAGSDYLLVVERDELDVERVRLYPLERGARP